MTTEHKPDRDRGSFSIAFPFSGFWWALLAFSALTVSWVCDVDLELGEHRIGCAPQQEAP